MSQGAYLHDLKMVEQSQILLLLGKVLLNLIKINFIAAVVVLSDSKMELKEAIIVGSLSLGVGLYLELHGKEPLE
jgi:hypothetical protein